LTRSLLPSTLIFSLLGISWAIGQWAPLALINASVAAQQAYKTAGSRKEFFNLAEDHFGGSPEASHLASNSSSNKDEQEEIQLETSELDAGVVMGIYNFSMAVPQIVAAIGSSGIFWLLSERGLDDAEVAGWVIRTGGLSALLAACLTLGIGIDDVYMNDV
jgi:solute carrier family 45 protein 1/2/4